MSNELNKAFIEKQFFVPNTVSIAVTWVDGRLIFKRDKKLSMTYYGICHYSEKVFLITPLDYIEPLMINTIGVSQSSNYCARQDTCLDFSCKLNKFKKDIFIQEFRDCGAFSLGLPSDMGNKPLWFSEGEWSTFFTKFIIPVTGGLLKFDEERFDRL